MLRQSRAPTAAGFSDDRLTKRVPGGLHALDIQDTAVKRIQQLQKTLNVFI